MTRRLNRPNAHESRCDCYYCRQIGPQEDAQRRETEERIDERLRERAESRIDRRIVPPGVLKPLSWDVLLGGADGRGTSTTAEEAEYSALRLYAPRKLPKDADVRW